MPMVGGSIVTDPDRDGGGSIVRSLNPKILQADAPPVISESLTNYATKANANQIGRFRRPRYPVV